jgi:quinol monooxygenase YgiN
MSVGIIATLKVHEGKENEFESIFRELTAAVRTNEPGNTLYQAFRSRKEKTTYIVMEIYENDDAIGAHRKSDHFRTLGAKMGPCLAGAPDVQFFDAV